MKTRLCLLPLALGAITGGLYFGAARFSPAIAAQSAVEPEPRAKQVAAPANSALRTTSTNRLTPASASGGATSPVASATGRFDRSMLGQILPTLGTPAADWRTFTPAQMTVVLAPGLPLDFVAKSITTDGKRTTWVGTNATEGATLVACATETLWDAIVTVPGADEYSIQITPDSVQVLEIPHGTANCGPTTAQLLATATADPLPAALTSAAIDTTTLQVADLLVLYSAGAKNNWGSTAEMENRIASVVAAANTYLEQSQIANLRWHLVGTAEAPAYATTEKLEDDLDRLDDATTELGRFAAERRTFFGADQVMLIVDGTRDYAGIAHLGTNAYLSVVHHPGSAATAAHELAHNFGCRHDRQTQNASDNDGHYHYGHRFTYNGQDMGTIMSYAPYLVPYFSNPSISYEGNPVGIAADQPKAADNARFLREHAADVARLRTSKTTSAPAITTQPGSVTITAGQTLSLSVTATGTDLTYQWARNGLDLLGATSATYSKTATTTSDGGTYTVLVKNLLSSVLSSAATVTVNPAPVVPTTPSNSGSSGGGGGGGGLELTSALGLIALLGSARRLRR